MSTAAPHVRLFTDLTLGEKSLAYIWWRKARRENSWMWGGQGVMWPIPADARIATPGRETWVTASPFDLLTYAESFH